MANIQAITKAKSIGEILKAFTGIEPEYIYYDDYVSIYYKKSDIPIIHEKINKAIQSTSGKKSDIKIDYLPLISPLIIKKVMPFAIALLVTGYLLGKKI